MASTSYQKVETQLLWKLEPKDLPVLRRLARGLSSFVYEITWQGKRHSRKDFPIGSIVGKSIFENETKCLFNLDHTNIVKCFGYTIGKSVCSLLQEYVDDNLQSIIQKRIELQRKELCASYSPSRVLSIDEIKGLLSSSNEEKEVIMVDQGVLGLESTTPFSLSESLDIISQIAIGMKYLHDNAIIHGDLKPKNVLVYQGLHGKFEVKINDFGLVGTKKHCRLDSKRRHHLDMLMWKAPELLDELFGPSTRYSNYPFIDSDTEEDNIEDEFKESESSHKFNKVKLSMADIYSFGLMCSYIFWGELMHPNSRLIQFQSKKLDGFRPKLPLSCPEVLNSLIYRCLELDPLKRPTFSTIVANFAMSTLKACLSDSPNSLEDEAEQQRNQELGRLYNSTLAGKHFQKDVVKGVENYISIGQKQIEISSMLAEDCKKYGSEGPSVKEKLSKVTVKYGVAKIKMEKERDNLHRALCTLVAEPLKAMANGSPLKDAQLLKQKYDRLRQDADSQSIEVSKRMSKESNPEQVVKLQAAELKLNEVTSAMEIMGKNALSAMSLVQAQQQNTSLQKILAMVEYERAYFQHVTSILDQLHLEIEAQVNLAAAPPPTPPQPTPAPTGKKAMAPPEVTQRAAIVEAEENSLQGKNFSFEERNHSYEEKEEPPPVADGKSFYATATNDFEGEELGELTISIGDEVLVHQVTSSGWSEGLCNGQSGWFPSSYVKKLLVRKGGGSRSGSYR